MKFIFSSGLKILLVKLVLEFGIIYQQRSILIFDLITAMHIGITVLGEVHHHRNTDSYRDIYDYFTPMII